MSGIVGSRLNIRGSGLVGSLGSDGQALTSSGAGTGMVFEAAGGFAVGDITGATALAATPATTDEFVLSDAGTLKRMDYDHIRGVHRNYWCWNHSDPQTIAEATTTKITLGGNLADPDSLVSSSTWTCPSDGDWFFFYSLSFLNSSDVQQASAYVFINDSANSRYETVHMHDGQTLNQWTLSTSWMQDVSEDDTYELYANCHATSHSAATSVKTDSASLFGGWKLAD